MAAYNLGYLKLPSCWGMDYNFLCYKFYFKSFSSLSSIITCSWSYILDCCICCWILTNWGSTRDFDLYLIALGEMVLLSIKFAALLSIIIVLCGRLELLPITLDLMEASSAPKVPVNMLGFWLLAIKRESAILDFVKSS